MALRIIDRLIEHARVRSACDALRQLDANGAETVLSYGELCTCVAALAEHIRETLPPRAVVMICYPNQMECLIAFYGVLAAGATVFPVHPQSSASELRAAAARSRELGT